jgi:putative transposase
MPRMNSIMERWVQTCRHELLDRTLIWNQPTFCTPCGSSSFLQRAPAASGHRERRPLRPLPVPLVVPDQIASLGIRRHDRLGGVLHEHQHAA